MKAWMKLVDEFNKAAVRSHEMHQNLLEEYGLISYIPDDAKPEIMQQFKQANQEFKRLLELKF